MTVQLIYVMLIILIVIVGSYVLGSLARYGWRKIAGPALVGIVLLSMCSISVLALGLPRPLWSMVYTNQSYRLIGWSFIEGRAIYVWLTPYDNGDPIVVQLPWSEQKADELAQTLERLNQSGQGGNVDIGPIARGVDGAIVTPVVIPKTTKVKVGS